LSNSSNFLIIHGHFYQPPRENPWVEAIERQFSAFPYHDWNERVAAECYAPNSFSRIIGAQYRIVDIVNNYERISFNFGATLLSWLKVKLPDTYNAIIEADKRSRTLFSGHGNAIAQVYNHIILPLANEHDKITQIKWGLEDFKYHFKREAEAIWLSETAINYPTLEALIDLNVKFIILSPFQAQRIRPLKMLNAWTDVSSGDIDTSEPYRCFLIDADGKKNKEKYIDIFFYHADLSKAVAFEHLLRDSQRFTERIKNAFDANHKKPQLISICTDGESYGHHEPFGDMGLAYLLYNEAEKYNIRLTNFAEYLEMNAPQMEVELKPGPNNEGTAWSCSHGVGRWYRNCGCSNGGPAEWQQHWRSPLRKALDRLRDDLSVIFETEGKKYLKDPWPARNDYIHVILDRSDKSRQRFFQKNADAELSPEQQSTVLNLMEMQRHAMYMYTSCGWFFADISGLEAVQILKYAARALEIGKKFTTSNIELKFLSELKNAKSNLRHVGDGRDIYESMVIPAIVDMPKIVNHYAILSTLEGFDEIGMVYHYEIKRLDYDKNIGAEKSLVIGSVEVKSRITMEIAQFVFVLFFQPKEQYKCMAKQLPSIKDYLQIKSCILNLYKEEAVFWKKMKKLWQEKEYSLSDMLYEEREKLYSILLKEKIEKLQQEFWHIYLANKHTIFDLKTQGLPIPDELKLPTELGLSPQLTAAIKDSLTNFKFDRAMEIVHIADELQLNLNKTESQEFFQDILEDKIIKLYKSMDHRFCDEMLQIFDICSKLKITLKESLIQNYLFLILREKLPPLIDEILNKKVIDNQYYLITSILRLAYNLNFDITEYKNQLKPIEQKLSENPDFWP